MNSTDSQRTNRSLVSRVQRKIRMVLSMTRNNQSDSGYRKRSDRGSSHVSSVTYSIKTKTVARINKIAQQERLTARTVRTYLLRTWIRQRLSNGHLLVTATSRRPTIRWPWCSHQKTVILKTSDHSLPLSQQSRSNQKLQWPRLWEISTSKMLRGLLPKASHYASYHQSNCSNSHQIIQTCLAPP